MKKSVFGLNENIAGLLCYLAGPFTGIVIYILERDNRFVRFHALQSTVTLSILWAAGWILRHIPFLGWIGAGILGVISFAAWAYLMFSAYRGLTFKVPYIGEAVSNVVNK